MFRLPNWMNVFKFPEDLWEKFSVTLICLLVYRTGAHIATPGVNVAALADVSDATKISSAAKAGRESRAARSRESGDRGEPRIS